MRAAGLLRRSLYSCRRYTTRSHLDILLRNPELDIADAQNELRWMNQSITNDATRDSELSAMVKRRSEGEPLQYILGKLLVAYLTAGTVDFGQLELLTRPPVLIPRPETAFIVEELARRLGQETGPLNILDLCTGSGCIPLLLSSILGDRLGVALGVDISHDAIALARDNIALVKDTKVRVFQADIFAPDFLERIQREIGGEPIHVVTSNPPYITETEYAALPSSVREHEDRGALVASSFDGVDGVAFYAHIAKLTSQILSPHPSSIPQIAVEIGAKQGPAVAKLLPGRTEIAQDQYGRDRMVLSVL